MSFKLFSQYKGLRKELYVLFLGRVMTNLGSMVFPILTLILNQKVGLNAAQIATYFLVYSIVSIPMTLVGGKLADKFNKRNVIVICDLLSITGFLVCAFIQMNLGAVILLSISGLLQTMESPSYDALIADFTTSKDRDRAYSLSYFGGNLGLVLAPTLGGLLFTYYLPVIFIINACSIAISTIVIFIFIKDVTREIDNSAEATYEKSLEGKVNVFQYVFKNKVILLFIIMAGFSDLVYSMYTYLMPLDLTNIYGDNGSVIFGTLSSVNCIVVVIFSAIITAIFSKFKELKRYLIGVCLVLIGYIVFVFLIKLPVFCYVSMVIFTFGEIFMTLASSPFVTKRIPASHRGRILSLRWVFASIFSSLITIGIGAIYDNFGSKWAWASVGIFGLITIAMLIVIIKLDHKYYKNLNHIVEVNGHDLSIKVMNKSLLKDYYLKYETDESIYLDKSLYRKYEYNDRDFEIYYKKITAQADRKNFLVILDGNPIGEIALKHINKKDKSAELSIHLQNDHYKNQGYGTAAEKQMIKYAFNSLGIITLYANTIITNERSQHVLEKVGFIKTSSDDNFVYYQITKA